MNNKGFTLIEVLASFVLMGIILGIAFPAIDNIYKENSTQIYEKYEIALKTAAKLYVDQYNPDLWTKEIDSCVSIAYTDIKCEGLIKELNGRNKSEVLDESKSYVVATRRNGSVKYQVYIYVKNEDNNKKVYETKQIPNSYGCSTNPISNLCQS